MFRNRYKTTRSISISSSSSTSQASENSAPDSDDGYKPKQRTHSTPNNMSERQMQKINSGSYGMFNGSPTLSSPSRTPKSRVKRGTATPTPVSRKRKAVVVVDEDDLAHERRQRGRASLDDDEEDVEDSLFVSEADAHETSTAVDDDEVASPDTPTAIDTSPDPFQNMPPDRKARAQSYIRALSATNSGPSAIAAAEDAVAKLEAQQAHLAQQLADLEPTTAERLEKIAFAKQEAIRQITEEAEKDTASVQVWAEQARAEYERARERCGVERDAAEVRVREVRAGVEDAGKRKRELEGEGGFELAWDVRDVEEGKRRRVV